MIMQQNRRWPIVAVLALLLAAACGGCSAVPQVDVAAERATFEAIAPEYLELVEAHTWHEDPIVNEQRKQLRRDTVARWDDRIQAWETEVAPPAPEDPNR